MMTKKQNSTSIIHTISRISHSITISSSIASCLHEQLHGIYFHFTGAAGSYSNRFHFSFFIFRLPYTTLLTFFRLESGVSTFFHLCKGTWRVSMCQFFMSAEYLVLSLFDSAKWLFCAFPFHCIFYSLMLVVAFFSFLFFIYQKHATDSGKRVVSSALVYLQA